MTYLIDANGPAADLSPSGLGRRSFLRMCAAAGIAPGFLTLSTKDVLAQASEIVLSNWGGDSTEVRREVFAAPFTAETGIAVSFDSSPLEGRVKAMVDSGSVIWDVMDLDAFSAIRLGKAGLLRPIDYSVVSGDTIPGSSFEHGVASYMISNVLAYNKDLFPDGGPQSWKDFWDVEKFPGKRALYKWAFGSLEAALLADGVPMDQLYPLDVPRALKKIGEIKDHLILWDSGAESQQMLRSGDVAMANIWSSRAHYLSKETDGRITFTWNEGIAFNQTWAVPKDNPAGDAVWQFIASTQIPGRQFALLEKMGVGPVTNQAIAELPPELTSINAGSPENMALQVLINQEWWADNYDQALAEFTDFTSN